MFETVVSITKPELEFVIEADKDDLDGLNFVAGKTLDYVNKKATDGVILAHTDGLVPNLLIELPEATAYQLGYMFYFFEKACGVSGYILGIDPSIISHPANCRLILQSNNSSKKNKNDISLSRLIKLIEIWDLKYKKG